MSSEKSETRHGSDDIPPTEQIIEEVVESCKKLGVDDQTKNSADDESDDDNNDGGRVDDEDFVDEVYLKDIDVSSSEEELERRKEKAIECKNLGNKLFSSGEYENSRKKYTEGLRDCPLKYSEERAILYANRGAAKIKQGLRSEAIQDCTKAIELNSKYVKAIMRRAKLYEEMEKLNEALEDYKKVLELSPDNAEARGAVMRLPAQINEQNEKLKAEMLGSLKELGNKLLRPFGLSTDNFQVQQDPNSGGYSINFKQNQK